MEKCFAGKLARGIRKANALHTSSELFAFRKIVRLLGGSIQKKENPLDFLSACSPRILAVRFYCYPLVLFCFTCYLSHSLCSWLVAFAKLRIARLSELFAFAKSFVCWVEVSKKKRTL